MTHRATDLPWDGDTSRALPTTTYHDDAFFRAEVRTIWHGDWVFVATEADLPDPGDRIAVDVAGQGVLLQRTSEGRLVALSNLCTHRGTPLVEGRCSGGKLVCPYHAWVFDDEGRLRGVPHDPDGVVDKESHGLERYRVEVWHGLVFVRLAADDGRVESVAERFAHLEPALGEAGLAELIPWPTTEEDEPWQANWKLVIANAMESYHVFSVHRETLQPLAPTSGAHTVGGSARGTLTGGSMRGAGDYLLVSLPPGFVGVLYPGAFLWQAVLPDGPTRTRVRTGGSFTGPPPSSGFSAWLTDLGARLTGHALPDFLPEDRAICERGQRGARGTFRPGKLVALERVLVDFHRYLAWRLLGTEPRPSDLEAPGS